MKFFNNENAVSEIVGAMFILLIIVLFLGGIQAYEVPKWNKELEKQTFDQVYKDFLELSSDFEDSSFKNLPITASMHTGVRYPERFSLRNPGQGAYGTITTYPVKINISYNSNGTIINENYTSFGMIYEMKGISDFPKLIYEHGIVIKDFGNWNNSDDANHLVTENGVFIPFLKGVEPIYSTEVETLNILPVTQYNFTEEIFMMNVTLETKYPGIWAKMFPVSSPPGSQYMIDNGKIRITDIPGFNLRNLSLPITSSIPDDNIYSGVIRFTDANTIIHTISNNMTRNITNTITNNFTNTSIYNITNNFTNNFTNNITNNITNTVITNITNTAITNITNNISVYSVSSNCSTTGFYIWDSSQGCMNLPPSASVQKFIIKDIRFGGSISNRDIIFSVQDTRGYLYKVQLHFDSNGTGDATAVTYQQLNPSGGCSPAPALINGEIDMTTCYRNSNIDSVNLLKINQVESGVLFAKLLIY